MAREIPGLWYDTKTPGPDISHYGPEWHGMACAPPLGRWGAACQLPPSESRGALLGVMVVEFASAIGIHTFCKVLYRSHRSPSDALMP